MVLLNGVTVKWTPTVHEGQEVVDVTISSPDGQEFSFSETGGYSLEEAAGEVSPWLGHYNLADGGLAYRQLWEDIEKMYFSCWSA
jgi:hypothetical protein